jgi:hypothetical protein
MLPAAYRAWASLPDIGEARLFAAEDWLQRLNLQGSRLLVPVHGLNPDEMRRTWRRCTHSMVM